MELLYLYLVCLCNNRMSHLKIFFVHSVRRVREVMYFVVGIQLVDREREFVRFFFHSSFKISIPLQAWICPEGFQDVEAPRT
jgi:hypothetical protein